MSGLTTGSTPASPERIVCVDQLRGYAIFGMFLVNASAIFFDPVMASIQGTALASFWEGMLYQLHHHGNAFSYADSIAPLFLFVVGMGMRLSWLRRKDRLARGEIRKSMLKRYMILVLIAFAIYTGWLWDALMYIGIAGILTIPFIDKSPAVRMAMAFVYVAIYQFFFLFTSYGLWMTTGDWSLSDPDYVPLAVQLVPMYGEIFGVNLNGGPLGPLNWVFMLLFGTYAYDLLAGSDRRKFVISCLAFGIGFCALGYLLSMIEWPGLKDAFLISKRWQTLPFPFVVTGIDFLTLLAFWVICDKLHLRIPTFTAVGMNPLVIYIAQNLILETAHNFEPERLSLIVGIIGFALFWAAFAGVAYYMHKRHIYVKL